jgi:hypothetical protein
VHEAISGALYVTVALIWLIPDRRIERILSRPVPEQSASGAATS